MFDNLKEFLECNKTYTTKEEQLNKEYKVLCQFNDKFNLDLLKDLSYIDIKKIYKLFQYRFNNKGQREKLENIYQEARLKEYPALNKAHYYPIINKMDFLNDKQKKDLDFVLSNFEGRYIMLYCHAWYELHFSEETTNKILEFLYNNKIIEKVYKISCHCGSDECEGELITEEQFNKFKQYHSITKEQMDKWTDKKWKEHNKKFDDGYFCIGCWNDGDYEICNMEDWNNANKTIIYKNVTKSDRSLDYV